MTQAQELQFTRALVRAQATGIQVVGRGTLKANKQQFISVSSATSGTAHCVRIVGSALVCDCKAGIAGRYCMHRAVARQAIETAALAKAVAAEEAAQSRQGFADMQFSETFAMLATINGDRPDWLVERSMEEM